MYIKGLIDKKIFTKNLVIVFFSLLLITILITIQKNLEFKVNQEYEQPQYRTLIFSSKEITEDNIKEYKNSIEEYSIDNQTFTILFNSKKDLDSFKKENESKLASVVESMTIQDNLSVVVSKVLFLIIIVSILIIITLIVIFNYNYFCNILKDIVLYNLLGFSKSKIFFLFSLFIHVIYFLFANLAILLVKVASLIFKFSMEFKYYIILFFIVLISFILTYLISYFILKKKNNLLVIKE